MKGSVAPLSTLERLAAEVASAERAVEKAVEKGYALGSLLETLHTSEDRLAASANHFAVAALVRVAQTADTVERLVEPMDRDEMFALKHLREALAVLAAGREVTP